MDHNLTIELRTKMRLPLIGSPMFIVSGPELVIAQCKAGIIGSFPALNARPQSQLSEWLHQIREELARHDAAHPDRPAAPFAVNQIVHRSNTRLEEDMATLAEHKVPIVITSLGARAEINDAVHSWGGITFHDVINRSFAMKAIEKGADGLVLVAAGAGGHAGDQSPFALVQEVREFFDGPIALSGAIANGGALLAAQAMGADFGYAGSAFIATHEANARDDYKQMVVDCGAEDLLYTDYFTGVRGNYLRPSITAAGLDPERLGSGDPSQMDFSAAASTDAKAWKDIWGCGQGIGAIKEQVSVDQLVDRLEAEYQAARARLCA